MTGREDEYDYLFKGELHVTYCTSTLYDELLYVVFMSGLSLLA